MHKTEPIHIIRIGIDILLLLFTVTAWILVHYVMPTPKNGLYCDDYTLSLPYKDSTVTNTMLILICTLLPSTIIIGTELIRKFYFQRNIKKPFVYKIKMFQRTFDIPGIIGNIYITLGSYTFGLLIVQFLTNLAKFTIGRPRPHFIDVCKPISVNTNQELIQNCNFKKYLQYGIDYICSSQNKKRLDEATLSFPSGHSSTSFYTTIFLIFYMRYIWKCNKNKHNCGFVIAFFQFTLFSLAFFTALSRVIDHKHHVTDVLAGSILGILFGILIFYIFTEFLNKRHYHLEIDTPQERQQSNTDDELLESRRQQRATFNSVYVDNV